MQVLESPPSSRVPSSRVPARWQPLESRSARDLPYDAFLREYVVPRRPVVIKDAVPSWPALRKWTPEFFKKHFPTRPVRVSYEKSMAFGEFIDRVLASTREQPGPYMYRLFLHEHLPEVLGDLVPQNPFAFPGRYASPLMLKYYRRPDGFLKLLIGGAGGRFPVMHYDGDESHAAITEIYGEKEFILYSPADTRCLYPNPARANHSLVDDPHEQDLDRFPMLSKARQHRTLLGPGDTVFVPYGWWHAARTLTPSISVCQNMVFRWDWKGFVAATTETDPGDRGPSGRARSLARQQFKRAYLAVAGPLMSAAEGIQMRHPRFARSMVLPALLAPVSSAVAPDPGKKPLRIRYPTG
jgi:hypothetical protein